MTASLGGRDRWADWLVHGRERGASKAQIRRMRTALHRMRDRVLRQAKLKQGERVLDVGAGTGLIALEARRKVGSSGRVVASDISHDALSVCRREAAPHDTLAPISFTVADVLRLPFPDQTFDAVFTRSVLIYLQDKQAGIRELYRVLKPGGRVSIFEPINEVSERAGDRLRANGHYDALQPEWGRIQEYYDTHKGEWWGTLVGWDERELSGWFDAAGFTSITMTFEYASRVSTKTPKKADVAARMKGRPNPNTPSYEEVARIVLRDHADEYLQRYAQFLLEPRAGRGETGSVYLVARR